MPREWPTEGSWAAAILKGPCCPGAEAAPGRRGCGGSRQSTEPRTGRECRPERLTAVGPGCAEVASRDTQLQRLQPRPFGPFIFPASYSLCPHPGEVGAAERVGKGEGGGGREKSWFFPTRFYLLFCRPGLKRGGGCEHERKWGKRWMSDGSFHRGLDQTADYLKMRSF